MRRWLAALLLVMPVGACQDEPVARVETRKDAGGASTEDAAPALGEGVLGVVVPAEEAILRAPAPGTVEEIRVELGAEIEEGAIVLVLAGPALERQVEVARANLEATKAKVRAAGARISFLRKRLRKLRKGRDVVAGAEIEAAVASLGEAQAQRSQLAAEVSAAEAELAAAEKIAAQAEVKAPLTGRVAEVQVEAGREVDRGDSLARIVGNAEPIIRFAIDREEARPEVGTSILFQIDEKTAVPGTIARVAAEIDPRAGVLVVEAALSEKVDLELGARGRVHIRTTAPVGE